MVLMERFSCYLPENPFEWLVTKVSIGRTQTFHLDGEATAPFGEDFYAVPIRHLWEKA